MEHCYPIVESGPHITHDWVTEGGKGRFKTQVTNKTDKRRIPIIFSDGWRKISYDGVSGNLVADYKKTPFEEQFKINRNNKPVAFAYKINSFASSLLLIFKDGTAEYTLFGSGRPVLYTDDGVIQKR